MDSNETGGLISTNIIWTGVMLLFGIPQKTASCKAMRQNVDGGSEAWKSRSLTSGGGKPSSALLLSFSQLLDLGALWAPQQSLGRSPSQNRIWWT